MTQKSLCILGVALVAALLGKPAQAGDWFKVESDHFVVTSDGSEEQVHEDVRQLEAYRSLGLLLLGADPNSAQAQVKFDVYLFRRADDMGRVRPSFNDHVGGAYFHCVEGSAAYSTLQESGRSDGTDAVLDPVRHEYAHHLMFQYARTYYPMWYVEGFAEFMSTASVADGKISLGQASPGRVQSLSIWAGPWLPFDGILKPSFGYAGATTINAPVVQSFYAQSWLLTHYMLSDSERTKKFNDYFARLSKGEDPIAAFEPATGIAIGSLAGLLRTYLEALPVLGVPSAAVPAESIKTILKPDGANDYLLNESLLKTCPAKTQGEAILAQLRALDAEAKTPVPERRLALARAEILFGSTQAALADLDAHAGEDEANFEAHYLRGRALLKNAYLLSGDARNVMTNQARVEFLKAYHLKKLDAPNLYFLAQSLDTDGVNNNVLNAARGARALAPNVSDYAIYEALIDIDVGDRDQAVRALTPLASDPHDGSGSAKARLAIAAVKAGKSRSEVRKLFSDGAS